jgi:adenine deaminase
MHEREQCRRVALGLDPPSLLIKGGRVFSPFTGEFFAADVVVCGALIAGVGDYSDAGAVSGGVRSSGASRAAPTCDAAEFVREIDAAGGYILPGLIDAHVHPETSLLSPPRFAEAL